MNNIFRHKVFVCFFLLFAFGASSQSTITVKAAVDKRGILIGERIQLTLEANIPESEPISFFIIDSVPHFEFLEKRKIDTLNTNSGTLIKQTILITSFDSGSFVIPSFMLSGNAQLRTDSIPVEVGFTPFDPARDYNDIKDILEVEIPKTDDWRWKIVVGAAVLIVIVIIIYVLRRRKKPKAVTPIVAINIYDDIMKQLMQLQKENLPPKLFHTRLVDIFRTYVYHRKGIQSLQKTTDDMIIQLKSLGFSTEQYTELAQALRLADFVKFAKYLPEEKDNQMVFGAIKKAIEEIEKSM